MCPVIQNTVIVAKVPVDDSQFDYDFTLTTSGGDEYTHGLNSFTEIPVDGDFAYYYHNFTFPIQLTGTAKLVKATLTPVSTTFRGNLSLHIEDVSLDTITLNSVNPTDATFTANTITKISPSGGTASLLTEGTDNTTITVNESGLYSIKWSTSVLNSSPGSTRAMPELRIFDASDTELCRTPFSYLRYAATHILNQECTLFIDANNKSIKVQGGNSSNRIAQYTATSNVLRFVKLR